MKKQYIKWAVTVICVLAAGICYSCGGLSGRGGPAGEQTFALHSYAEEDAGAGAAALEQDGTESAQDLISAGEEESGTEGSQGAGAGSGDTSSAEGGISGGSDTSEPVGAVCYVHICGEVADPGVYELAPGSRIFEAVEAAGGFTEAAAASYLNLAQEICDGMKIVVPSEQELAQLAESGLPAAEALPGVYRASEDSVRSGASAPGAAGAVSGGAGSGTDPAAGKVNINTAGREELMTLRGIGEARADDIIRYRETNGPFRTIEDIMKVSGIKEAAFEKIKENITV